jgi:hypothetical protein
LAISVSSLPFLVRFELSRPTLDDAARRVQAGQVEPNRSVSLGLFGERQPQTSEAGYLEFYLGESGLLFGDDWYLVLIPEGTQPPEVACYDWQHVDGPWWLMADDLWCEF